MSTLRSSSPKLPTQPSAEQSQRVTGFEPNSPSADTGLAIETDDFSSSNEILHKLYEALRSFTPAQQEELAPHVNNLPTATYLDEDEQEDNGKMDGNNDYHDPQLQTIEGDLKATLIMQQNEVPQNEINDLISKISTIIRQGNQTLLMAVLPNEDTFVNLKIESEDHDKSIKAITKAIDNLAQSGNSSQKDLQNLMRNSIKYLEYKNELIKIKYKQLENYRSPESKEKLLSQRRFFHQVALRAHQKINTELKNLPKGQIPQNLETHQRSTNDRLNDQSISIEQNHSSPEDEKSKGMEILSEFLEKIKLSSYISLEKIWNQARAEVLDQGRDWKIIDCEFTVHEQSPIHLKETLQTNNINALITHKIHTTTTPIGHILNQKEVSINSIDSPLSKKECAHYKIQSITDGQEITAGRHSHAATEHLHAVNAAKTECAVNGKVVFKALRHATISPYQLTQNTFEEMSAEKQKEVISDLNENRTGITEIISEKIPLKSDQTGSDSTTGKSTVVESEKTKLEELWATKTIKLSPEAITRMAKTDPELFALIRRRAGLNRAREVFVSSIMSDPELRERIKNGQTIVYNSISLLTPSPLGKFQHKLKQFFGMDTRGTASHDELTMTEDQLQAWDDLQEEIQKKRLTVDGKPVSASINTFTFGVNTVSVGILTEKIVSFLGYLERAASGPISMLVSAFRSHIAKNDDFLTGWKTIRPSNEKSLKNLLGDLDSNPNDRFKDDFSKSQLFNCLEELEEEILSSNDIEKEKRLMQQIDTMKELARQLLEMWQEGGYRNKDILPYEFTSRLALLSSMMKAGTAFNCKSGKDRTAQLDADAKFLAFQIETNSGKVPEWDRKYSLEEQTQFANFIFYDESRRTMQEYNTGVGGTKVNANFDLFFKKFLVAPNDELMVNQIKREFIGLSKHTKS